MSSQSLHLGLLHQTFPFNIAKFLSFDFLTTSYYCWYKVVFFRVFALLLLGLSLLIAAGPLTASDSALYLLNAVGEIVWQGCFLLEESVV